MVFGGLGITTDDVPRLARFYAEVFGVEWDGDDVHTVIDAGGVGIAICHKRVAIEDMGMTLTPDWGAGAVTLCFDVPDAADVDALHERFTRMGAQFAAPPHTYQWGARSMHMRDPDGNILCFRARVHNT